MILENGTKVKLCLENSDLATGVITGIIGENTPSTRKYRCDLDNGLKNVIINPELLQENSDDPNIIRDFSGGNCPKCGHSLDHIDDIWDDKYNDMDFGCTNCKSRIKMVFKFVHYEVSD